MSTGQSFWPPMRPSLFACSVITRWISGRPGSHCAVSARPTSTFSGWMIVPQLSSYWWPYAACLITAQASSRVTVLMRFRTASGTLGRPSAKRSPWNSGVYLMSRSRGRIPGWENAGTASSTATMMVGRYVWFMAITLSRSRFLEPGRARHLRFARGVIVHFHTQAGAFGKSDVPLLDDFALFDEVAPQVRRIDPVPLLHQEIGNRGAYVGGRHHADGRCDGMRGHGDVVGVRHVGDLARFQEAAALLEIGHDDVGGALLQNLAESVPQKNVLAAADGRAGGGAIVAHGVDFSRRHRFLEP